MCRNTTKLNVRSTCLVFAAVCSLLGRCEVAHALPVTALPDMSLFTDFATFGAYYNDHNVTINGDVGISDNGKLKLESPSHINGDVYLDQGVTTSGGGWPGNVSGTIYTGYDVTAVQNQVIAAATTLAALTPTFTYASLGMPLTVNGNGELTVVNITGNVDLGSGDDITFTGGINDYFVLNIFGDLDMGGDAAIQGSGVDASHILVNLYSSGSLGNIAHVDNVINASLLIPNATYAELHSVNGAIYSGAGQVKLMSGATVNYVPFEPPTRVADGGSSALLVSIALGLLGAAKRKSAC